MLENNTELYRQAYILLMSACNNALDLLPGGAVTATNCCKAPWNRRKKFFSAPRKQQSNI